MGRIRIGNPLPGLRLRVWSLIGAAALCCLITLVLVVAHGRPPGGSTAVHLLTTGPEFRADCPGGRHAARCVIDHVRSRGPVAGPDHIDVYVEVRDRRSTLVHRPGSIQPLSALADIVSELPPPSAVTMADRLEDVVLSARRPTIAWLGHEALVALRARPGAELAGLATPGGAATLPPPIAIVADWARGFSVPSTGRASVCATLSSALGSRPPTTGDAPDTALSRLVAACAAGCAEHDNAAALACCDSADVECIHAALAPLGTAQRNGVRPPRPEGSQPLQTCSLSATLLPSNATLPNLDPARRALADAHSLGLLCLGVRTTPPPHCARYAGCDSITMGGVHPSGLLTNPPATASGIPAPRIHLLMADASGSMLRPGTTEHIPHVREAADRLLEALRRGTLGQGAFHPGDLICPALFSTNITWLGPCVPLDAGLEAAERLTAILEGREPMPGGVDDTQTDFGVPASSALNLPFNIRLAANAQPDGTRPLLPDHTVWATEDAGCVGRTEATWLDSAGHLILQIAHGPACPAHEPRPSNTVHAWLLSDCRPDVALAAQHAVTRLSADLGNVVAPDHAGLPPTVHLPAPSHDEGGCMPSLRDGSDAKGRRRRSSVPCCQLLRDRLVISGRLQVDLF